MTEFDLDAYVARSRAVGMSDIPWDDVRRYPLSADAVRAVDEPDVATFLACWLYEESFHGIALARFLEAAGHPVGTRPRPRGQEPLLKRIEAAAVARLSRLWPDFCALHMTWGAINELTTLTGYRRLAKVAGHPVLDESRHFFFYYRQAEIRLQRPAAARVSRMIVDRFWAPVGSGERAQADVRFLAGYLFADAEGRAAARKVDDTIRRLPGFQTVRLLDAWLDRIAASPRSPEGGRNGHGHH